MDALFFVISFISGICIVGTILTYCLQEEMEFPGAPLLALLICFVMSVGVQVGLHNYEKSHVTQEQIDALARQVEIEKHKFDNDTVVITGRADEMNDLVASYVAHGYAPVGGCSSYGQYHEYLCQTMTRKK